MFRIECRLDGVVDSVDLVFPSWTPGSYLLREFGRYVVAARSEGRLEKINHSSWRCASESGAIVFEADVYALDQSVRGAWVDLSRAYFNGACVFPFPRGREHEAVELVIEAPRDTITSEWRVATAMTPEQVDARGFGTYTAVDYDELIDHPVEIGAFASMPFAAAGVPHELVVAGRHDADLRRVATDLGQLCEAHIEFFGRPAPFTKYCFLGLVVGDGYGGLEHRSSSSLIFSRSDLPRVGEPGMPKAYQRFLGLASHEYFHTWNVKRIKPAAFVPYRLDERNHTRSLWVFEGITTYYQDLMLLRSGLIGADAYLVALGELLTRVFRIPGRARQSLAEASFDAWDRLYKPEPHSINAGISYYTKGALVALAVDLMLRRDTGGALSLDAIMRALWQRYADDGVPEGGFEALVVELAGPELEEFFATAVHGVADPPIAELLHDFGIELRLRPSLGGDDRGGTPGPVLERPRLWLGAGVRGLDGGFEIGHVLEGGPAEQAGLLPKDQVVAIDGLKVNEKSLEARLDRCEPGQRVEVTLFRGDELLSRPLVVEAAPADTCYLDLAGEAPDAALERRRAWLGR